MIQESRRAKDRATRKSNEPLRLRLIHVQNLFGIYNHNVSLNIEERVTIIHGPNGVGKTVLLSLIQSVFDGKYFELTRYPFSQIRFDFQDYSSLLISSTENYDRLDESVAYKNRGIDKAAFTISLSAPGDKSQSTSFEWSLEQNIAMLARAEPYIPIQRQSADGWIDQTTGESITSLEALARFSDSIPASVRQTVSIEPEWLNTFRSRLPVFSIETQRLLDFVKSRNSRYNQFESSEPFTYAVKAISLDLTNRITQNLRTYANRSQALDQSFPRRLLTSKVNSYSVSQLKNTITHLDNRRTELRTFGLLGDVADYPLESETLDKVGDQERAVMTLYVDDSIAKLQPLDDLLNRVRLLLDIVNGKFKHKSLSISAQLGLVIKDDNGRNLALNVLSSGEQHELVLTYSLLFKMRKNSLVLIDEPELSLHIDWQERFLADLLQIVKSNGFDVLLATHSPNIVGDYDSLMVPLSSDSSE